MKDGKKKALPVKRKTVETTDLPCAADLRRYGGKITKKTVMGIADQDEAWRAINQMVEDGMDKKSASTYRSQWKRQHVEKANDDNQTVASTTAVVKTVDKNDYSIHQLLHKFCKEKRKAWVVELDKLNEEMRKLKKRIKYTAKALDDSKKVDVHYNTDDEEKQQDDNNSSSDDNSNSNDDNSNSSDNNSSDDEEVEVGDEKETGDVEAENAEDDDE